MYDLSGNLKEKFDNDGYTTSFSYSAAGDISKIRYGNGKEVRFSYDPIRQLVEIEDWLGITQGIPVCIKGNPRGIYP